MVLMSLTLAQFIHQDPLRGIAAGVRRIEALTGDGLMRYYENLEQELAEAAKAAKTTPADLKAKIESMLEEMKTLHAENDKLKSKLANESLGDVMRPGS